MKIFSDLELIDRTGHGVPLIVKKYGKEIFNISKETIRIFIPLNKKLLEEIPDNINLNKSELEILNKISINPYITTDKLMNSTNLSESYINKIFKILKEKNILVRVGSNKYGYWKINK